MLYDIVLNGSISWDVDTYLISDQVKKFMLPVLEVDRYSGQN